MSRALSAASTLAALAVVVALTAAVLVGVSGWVARATGEASGEAVASAVGAAGAVLVSAPAASSKGDDSGAAAAAQDAAVTAFLIDRFAGAAKENGAKDGADTGAGTGAGVPVQVSHTLSVGAVALSAASDADPGSAGGGGRAVVIADDTLGDDAALVDGAWPGPGETAVQAAAAAALGIAVGDAVELGGSAAEPGSGTVLTVSGTWQPEDELAPRWAGRPAFTSGRDGADAGPFVVTGEQLLALGGTPRSSWVVTPAGRPGPAQVREIADAADPTTLESALDVAGVVGTEPVAISGGLGDTARRAGAAATAATNLTAAALVLLVLVVALGSSRLIVLGSRRREGADLLLRARGASRAQLVRWSAVETAAAVLPAAALGVAAGWVGLAALRSVSGEAAGGAAPGGAVAIDPVGLLATAALVLALLGTAAAQPVPLPPLGRRALPAGALRIIGLVVLVVAAGVAVGQLLSSPGELGSAGIAAVPLALLAASVAASAAVAAWARRRTTFGGRARSVWLFTALRSLRMRAAWFTAVALVVMLASALAVVASTLPGAVQAAQDAVVSDEVGTDAAVRLDTPTVVPVTAAAAAAETSSNPSTTTSTTTTTSAADPATPLLAALQETPGTRAASAVLATTVAVGRENIRAIALPADAAAPLTGTAFLPDSPRPAGLGPTTETVSVRVTAEERTRPGALSGTAWLAAGDGALAAVDLGSVPLAAADGAELSAPLPTGFADAELLGIDLRYDAAGDPDSEHVTVDAVAGLDASGAVASGYGTERLSRPELQLSSSQAVGRVLVDDPDAPLPVTLSTDAATKLGLAVGDDFGFTPASGRSLDATVQRLVPSIPGAGGSPALALDIADLARASLGASSSVLAPATVWVATSDPAAVARTTAARSDAPWSVATRQAAGASGFVSTGVAVWLIVAGVAVLMAVVAITANGAVLRRARRGDEATLRALGFLDRQRRLRRLAETGAAVAVSVVAGILIGALTAAVCTPAMGASAVGGSTVAAPFADLAPPMLGAMLVALLVALAAATLLASAEPGSGRAR